MLDLQASVHLHEIEGAVLVSDELDGSGTDIADRLGRRDGRIAHRLAPRRIHTGRRRFLDDLLVAALDRAVALEQIDAVAMPVGENLDFDMARPRQVLLDQHMIVGERRLGLAFGAFQRIVELFRRLDHPHALAAAASRGLDQDGKSDAGRLLCQERRRLIVAVIARHQRHPGLPHDLLGFALRTHGADRRRRRSDKDHAHLAAGLGEARILRQETVAWMDRFRARAPARVEDPVGHEVAVARRGAADVHGLVGHRNVPRIGIGIRIDRNCPDAQSPRGLDDPASDLAAIGDQNLREHLNSPISVCAFRGTPSCLGGPLR